MIKLPSGVDINNLIDDIRIFSWQAADILLYYSKLLENSDYKKNILKNNNESDVISPETIKAIDGFKSEMMTTRAELRNVKFQLRSDVDNLKTKIMFINIGLIPILIAGLALIIAIRRPKPKKIIH